VGDGISGNAGFGSGTLLLTTSAILGTVMDWDFRPLNPPMLGDFETDK
jgi:hypothetical protein